MEAGVPGAPGHTALAPVEPASSQQTGNATSPSTHHSLLLLLDYCSVLFFFIHFCGQ